jgi:hypothetical protein
MVVVGMLGLLLAGIATGALTVTLGGPAWSAALYGLIPGAYAAARITVADNLAMGFMLLALLLSLRRQYRWAVVVAVLAVLTREVSLVPLVGFALWRRDRAGVAMALVPAMALAAWYFALQQIFSGVGISDGRSGFLVGFRAAWPTWTSTDWPTSLVIVGCTYAAVVAVVVLRRQSPMFWPVIVSAVLPLFLDVSALTLFFNVSRSFLPLLALCGIALLGRNQPRAKLLATIPARTRHTPLVPGG